MGMLIHSTSVPGCARTKITARGVIRSFLANILFGTRPIGNAIYLTENVLKKEQVTLTERSRPIFTKLMNVPGLKYPVSIFSQEI